jgi:phosphatidylserine/phosphatidylglycerophosphate/cardiolipin synthase-like enzyme
MSTVSVGVADARCALVADGEYPDILISLLDATVQRCLISMFIVDFAQVSRSPLLDVLDALGAAAWRGVDVRVVLGGSRTNVRIAQSTASARAVLASRGVPVRWLSAQPVRGSHAKVVVADNQCLLGSHNLSYGAMSGLQRQDSLLIDSAAFAGLMHQQFDQQWQRAGEQA